MNQREWERLMRRSERQSACGKAADALPSVKSAAFWHRMYRYDLYRRTDLHNQLRKKLDLAQARAFAEVDALMEKHRIKSLPLGNMKNGDGVLYHVPSWKDVPYAHEARANRLRRRIAERHRRALGTQRDGEDL